MTNTSHCARRGARRTPCHSIAEPRRWLLLFAFLVSYVAVNADATAATAAWSNVDIGAVSAHGSYSLNNGVFTVSGSGVDIWNTADSFQFVSQPLTGDGSITARVVSQTNTNAWAKAGVMFRETLAAGATNAIMGVTPGNGAVLQSRTPTGGTSSAIHGPIVKAPYWVRLVRAGNVFSGSISADGVSWTSLGKYTVTMASQVYVGLAVTSHANGSLSTAAFDHVTVASTATAAPATATTSASITSVSISPTLVSVAVAGTQTFVATVVNSAHGTATWKVNGVTGGTSTLGTISSAGAYKAPASAPVPATVTVTAVSVDDPTKSASASATIVAAAARPTISGSPPTTATVGHSYAFTPTTTSASGAKLTFSIFGRPAWATFNAASGSLSGVPASGDIGTFANISISVTDGTTVVSLPAFTITVSATTTGSATVNWSAPTTRTDGTSLANIAGYRIHYGTSPGSYPTTITVANPGLTSYVVANLPAATYYFTVSAYDTNALESVYSAPVSKVIQ